MEMNFGGPVWHASARSHDGLRSTMEAMAFNALAGVGDIALGQWMEYGREAVHVRRRLAPREAARVNGLRDIRGTAEERQRLGALAKELPHMAPFILERVRV